VSKCRAGLQSGGGPKFKRFGRRSRCASPGRNPRLHFSGRLRKVFFGPFAKNLGGASRGWLGPLLVTLAEASHLFLQSLANPSNLSLTAHSRSRSRNVERDSWFILGTRKMHARKSLAMPILVTTGVTAGSNLLRCLEAAISTAVVSPRGGALLGINATRPRNAERTTLLGLAA